MLIIRNNSHWIDESCIFVVIAEPVFKLSTSSKIVVHGSWTFFFGWYTDDVGTLEIIVFYKKYTAYLFIGLKTITQDCSFHHDVYGDSFGISGQH